MYYCIEKLNNTNFSLVIYLIFSLCFKVYVIFCKEFVWRLFFIMCGIFIIVSIVPMRFKKWVPILRFNKWKHTIILTSKKVLFVIKCEGSTQVIHKSAIERDPLSLSNIVSPSNLFTWTWFLFVRASSIR